MFRILHDTKIDFLRYWKYAVGITLAVIVVGMASFAFKPVNLSIEFAGGTMVHVRFLGDPPPVDAIRSNLASAGIPDAVIQAYGSNREFTIRATERADQVAAPGADSVGRQIRDVLMTTFGGAENVRIERTEAVGPRVGGELSRGAIMAIALSMLVVLGYLAWRFEWRFGVAAVIATLHDVAATIGFVKLMNLEVSLMIVAGVLTVLGYSLNDTIIIFDRVRENLRRKRKEALYDTLNRSINETLPRTVLTHTTTLAATLSLLFLAGEVLRPFAWIMTFGIIVGTMSSMAIASPALLWIERRWPREVGERSVARISRESLTGAPAEPAPQPAATRKVSKSKSG